MERSRALPCRSYCEPFRFFGCCLVDDSGVVVCFGRRLNFMESGYAAGVAEAGDRRADHRLPCFADCLCGADIYSTKWLETFAGKADMDIVQAALAIAFWIILLVLLLRHQYQVEKEIKTVRAALFYKYNNEQP